MFPRGSRAKIKMYSSRSPEIECLVYSRNASRTQYRIDTHTRVPPDPSDQDWIRYTSPLFHTQQTAMQYQYCSLQSIIKSKNIMEWNSQIHHFRFFNRSAACSCWNRRILLLLLLLRPRGVRLRRYGRVGGSRCLVGHRIGGDRYRS